MKQNINRREFLRLGATAAAAAALAACKPAAPATTAPSTTQGAGAPATKFEGTLRVQPNAPTPPVQPVVELIAAVITSKYPNLKIKWEYQTGDYTEGLYTKAAAGTLADVFFSADLFTVPFAKNGVSLDLKPLLQGDTEVDVNDVYPSMLGLCEFNGQIHGLPEGLDVVTMYYNKTLFDKAGAQLPQDTWTWDDFVTNTKKITALDKDQNGNPMYWGLSNATWNWWATVHPWIVGYGGKILDNGKSTWTDAKTLAGLTAYAELWTKHNIVQPLGLDVGGDAFQLGRAATYTHIQALRTPIRDAVADKFDWDVQVMPLMPDGKHRTGMGTWSLSVFSKSPMKDAAFAFVKQIITPAIQRLMASKEIAVPLLKSMTKDSSWSEGLKTPPKNFQAFVKGADDAVLPPTDYPADCGSYYAGLMMTNYQGALEAVIRGTKNAGEAFKAADDAIQACLDKNK